MCSSDSAAFPKVCNDKLLKASTTSLSLLPCLLLGQNFLNCHPTGASSWFKDIHLPPRLTGPHRDATHAVSYSHSVKLYTFKFVIFTCQYILNENRAYYEWKTSIIQDIVKWWSQKIQSKMAEWDAPDTPSPRNINLMTTHGLGHLYGSLGVHLICSSTSVEQKKNWKRCLSQRNLNKGKKSFTLLHHPSSMAAQLTAKTPWSTVSPLGKQTESLLPQPLQDVAQKATLSVPQRTQRQSAQLNIVCAG